MTADVQEEDNKPKAPAEESPGGAGIPLGDFIEVFPDRPLPQFDKGENKAYTARDTREGGKGAGVFAVICGKATAPRLSAMSAFKSFSNPQLMQVVTGGVVNWVPEGTQKYGVVFERPIGAPLMETLESSRTPMSEDDVTLLVMQPMMNVISEFRDSDNVHGCINPMNMYEGGTGGGEKVLLGEALSAPPSYGQPVLFETIERGMAGPNGRGLGTIEDDLYAFGVTVAMLMCGRNTLHGKTDTEIILEKIDKGTYGAILGSERLPGGINEFLRGVLNDDATQRWNVDEALKWMDGRRLSPKQPQMKGKAARPFDFGNDKYHRPQALAMAFGEDATAASRSIEEGELEQWLQRSLEDEDMMGRLEYAMESAKEGGVSGYHERLVSRTCIALDPDGPIRYRGYTFFPRGYGYTLAEAVAGGQDTQPFAEMLAQQGISFWLNSQTEMSGDAVAMANQFENCKSFVQQKLLGYGVERTLYYMNPEVPCLSPVLDKYYVSHAGDLLLAYEDMASRDMMPTTLIDRDMAAFLSVRDKDVINNIMGKLGSDDPSTYMLGVLTVFANIQKQFNVPSVPALGQWLGDKLEPVVEQYHNQKLQENMKRDIGRAKRTGDLNQLLAIVDDVSIMKEDDQGFSIAKMEYALLQRERLGLQKNLAQKASFGKGAGREVAVMVSSVISAAIILATVILFMTGKF